ncbi:MAG: hypothetical protein JNL68_13755 [Burkholderiales bacterium]|nr:hypothetical protein [Burkholderiales bacterium]
MRRCIEIRALILLAACAAAIGTTTTPVYAKTEAEAADELIAVLGVTLPCPHFAAAWLETPPATIEYRCTPSLEGAIRLRESLPRERVGYIIDMQVARDRYASAYRFRRTPTAPVALAQYVAGNAVPELPKDKLRGPVSPLIVYSRATASPDVRDTAGASRRIEAFR